VKASSSINNSLAIPLSKRVLTDSVAGARTRATAFFLNPMRSLLKVWELNTLFCLNPAINQGNGSNMKNNAISDKDAIGIMEWKGVSAILKEPLVSSAACAGEN
jgi:hypothetical protein